MIVVMEKMRTAMQCCFKVSLTTLTQAERERLENCGYILPELILSTKFEVFFLKTILWIFDKAIDF